ncbi:Diaminopimelate decarboxylase [Desulfamplus magnetovallimortis]|uniref:Diaminopimelate decarboxylase n=1 Tax=Desulfamplus magnetovallimortis TaxID=1246637 RepID=A0A1W1HA04_9BACT|nr:diaminopimelate decarboxylase [Desulfamplus magnetovallimortis]SLM29273.1 Diaminopimelate decarboxylase [Desulfamplus magnetovallimortis]
MPMSEAFHRRLSEVLEKTVEHFGTPFHIYDEIGIIETCETLKKAFAGREGFKEFFAVKALPNPDIMKIMKDQGFGFDCSSAPELLLSESINSRGEELMFTSNNTSVKDFEAAADSGAILNLDDISLIPKVMAMPELICFRYNPGPRRKGNKIIGNPIESKYGVSHDQIVDAYRLVINRGAKRFGMHTMLASNELNHEYMVETTSMLLSMVELVAEELDITFEFINIGGGVGIPYRPDQIPLNIEAMGKECIDLLDSFEEKKGWAPLLFMESGRYMTGPHGALITKVINHKNIYRKYVGVDASMSSLMRPGMYEAYHHIHIHGKENAKSYETVDVVGSLCENIDKFAVQRSLPLTTEGDILVIHDTGAHGHAMGFNYNANLRPKELLLRADGRVELIRREETPEDYFATLRFEKDILH